jgi:integrase
MKQCEVARTREPFVYPVLFAALCPGMRRGKLLALRWERIGATDIRVRDAHVNGQIKTPKSGKARTIPIETEFGEVLQELRRTRKQREGPFSEPAYVFTTATEIR